MKKISQNAINAYLRMKLCEDKQFMNAHPEDEDIQEMGSSYVSSTEKLLATDALQNDLCDIEQEWNEAVSAIERLIHKGFELNPYLGSYLKHRAER